MKVNHERFYGKEGGIEFPGVFQGRRFESCFSFPLIGKVQKPGYFETCCLKVLKFVFFLLLFSVLILYGIHFLVCLPALSPGWTFPWLLNFPIFIYHVSSDSFLSVYYWKCGSVANFVVNPKSNFWVLVVIFFMCRIFRPNNFPDINPSVFQ